MNKTKPQSTTTVAASTSKSSKPVRSTVPKSTARVFKKPVASTEPAEKTPTSAKKTVPASSVAARTPAKSVTRKVAPALPASKASDKTTASENKKDVSASNLRTRKSKLLRDSFAFPEADYALFKVLKMRAIEAGIKVKKGELVRAGMATLALMSPVELTKALAGVERIRKNQTKKK